MSEDQLPVDRALEFMKEAERSRAASTATVGDEWCAVLALRARSLSEYVGGVQLSAGARQRIYAARYAEDAERRRPSGRRVHTVAERGALLADVTRRLGRAEESEAAALAALGVPDLDAARIAVEHLNVQEAIAWSGAREEWVTAVGMVPALRAWREKRRRALFVRGRAEQATQPLGGLVPLSTFERYELGGATLPRKSESGPAGTISSAVELIARWDLAADPRASGDPSKAALEAIRGVRRGEHNNSAFAKLAVMRRAQDWDTRLNDEVDEEDWDVEGDETFGHITEMRARVARCFARFGLPVQPGTWAVNSSLFHLDGHIDFVSETTIWDLKVSTTPPTPVDILQLLLYWQVFRNDPANELGIGYVGIFNPRVDVAWRFATASLTPEVVGALEAIALGEYRRV